MDYQQLALLPLLNGVTIIGDRLLEDYGLVPISAEEITELFLEVNGYVL
jgi:hypothetical protein